MRTRVRGLSAAVLLCACVPAFAQTCSPPWLREPTKTTPPLSQPWVEHPAFVAKQSLFEPIDAGQVAEVRFDCRVLTVSGKESRAAVAKLFDVKGEPKTAILTEKELFAVLETCAGDRTTNILQAPRITADASKPATVKITDTTMYTTAVMVKSVNGKTLVVPTTEAVETGMQFNISATPSSDGKLIELKMVYHDRQAKPHTPLLPVTIFLMPEGGAKDAKPVPCTQFVQMPEFSEIKVQQVGNVPDGGTMAVLAGRQTRLTTATDSNAPVISTIPYLNRLFKNGGAVEVESDVVVFVTARCMASPQEVVPVSSQMAVKPDAELAKILADYQRACKSGNTAEATRLAVQALAKDPTCFGK